jgi:hypothetical protein
MDASEVSLPGKKKGVITSAVQEMRIVKIIYIYYLDHVGVWQGAGGEV